MEVETINNLNHDKTNGFVINSFGPVDAVESMEEDTDLQIEGKELVCMAFFL